MAATLDHNMFPHILDLILDFSCPRALTNFAGTNKAIHERVFDNCAAVEGYQWPPANVDCRVSQSRRSIPTWTSTLPSSLNDVPVTFNLGNVVRDVFSDFWLNGWEWEGPGHEAVLLLV